MIPYTIRLTQAAHLGSRPRSDFIRHTDRRIEGATVRGAFAAAWIRDHGEPTPTSPRRADFLRLFEGGVRFSPLYAADPPISLAVVGHKYPVLDTCRADEFDLASERKPPKTCPDCGQTLVPRRDLRDSGWIPVSRKPGLQVGDDGVAVDGNLFAIDSVRPGVGFTGELHGDPADIEELLSLEDLRVGGRRATRGAVTLRPSTATPAALPANAPQRISAQEIVIRLASPAVFVDAEGRPSSAPSADELSETLGVDTTVVKRWHRWRTVGGWHAASGLPKPMETAVAAGSTYVCHLAGRADDAALTRLAERGVGLRRHEGFGHLAPPTPLAFTPKQRMALRQRWDAEAADAASPPGFIQALEQVAQGREARESLTAYVEAVADHMTGKRTAALAKAPLLELRRVLAERGDQ